MTEYVVLEPIAAISERTPTHVHEKMSLDWAEPLRSLKRQ